MILITNVVLIFGLISAVICQVKASRNDTSDTYGDGSQRHQFFFRGGGHEEFNILRERSAKDPLEERSAKDPLEERSAKDPLEERSAKDPLEERSAKDPLEERSSAVINEQSLLDTKSQDQQTKTYVDSSHLFTASPEQDGQNMLSKLISITTQNGRNIGIPDLNNQTGQISKSESESVRKVYDFDKEPFLPIPGPFSNSKFPKPSFIYHIKRPSTFEENIFKKQEDTHSRIENRNSGKSVGENGQQNDSPLHSQSSIDQQTSFETSNFYQKFPFSVQFPVHSGNNPSELPKYSQEERSDPSSLKKDSDNGQYFVSMFHRVANKSLNFSDSDITETSLPEASKDDFRTMLGISWKGYYPKPSTAERDSKGNPKHVKDDAYDESSQIPAPSSREEKLAQPRQDQTLKDVRTFYVNGPYFEDTTNYGTDDWSLRDRVVVGGEDDDTTEGVAYSKNSPYEDDATIFSLGSQSPRDGFIHFQNKNLHKSTETLDEHTEGFVVDNGDHVDLQRNTPLGDDYYKHLFGEVSSYGGTGKSGLINGFNEYRQAAAGRHEFAVKGPGEWKIKLKREIKPSDHEQKKISFAVESSPSKDIDLQSTLSEINQKNEFPEIPTTRESPSHDYKEELDTQNADPISKKIVSYHNKKEPMTEAEFTQNSNGRGNHNSGNLEREFSGNMSLFGISENLKPVVHVYTIVRKTSKGISGERGSNDDSKSYRQGRYFDGSFETGPFLRDEVAMFGKQRNNDDSETMENLNLEAYGKPGYDFPVYHRIPATSFRCKDQEYPGYYADPETNCQVFHRCQIDGTMDSFLCPNASIFNQKYFVCDWWYNVDCQQSRSFYHLNSKWMEETDDNEVENALKEHGFISHITENGFMLRVGDLKHSLINSAVDVNSVVHFGRDKKESSAHEEDLQRNLMKDESEIYEQEKEIFQKSDQEQMIRSHIPIDSVNGDFVEKKRKKCKKSKPNEGIIGMRKLGMLADTLSVSNFPNAKFEDTRSLKQENTFEKTEPIGLKGEVSDIPDIENFNRGYGYALNAGKKYFGPENHFGHGNNFGNSGLIRENTRPNEIIRSKENEKPNADRNFGIESYVDNENRGKKTFRENETLYPNEDISDEGFQRDFGIRNQNHKFGDDGKHEKENTFSSSKYSKDNEDRDEQEYDRVHLSHDSPILFKNGDGRNEDENIFSSSKYSKDSDVRDEEEHEHVPLYDTPIPFKNGDGNHEDETTFSSSKYSKAKDVRDQQEYDHVPLYDAPISFKNGDQFRDDFNLGKKYIFGEYTPLSPEAKYIRTTEEDATSSVNKNFGYDENLGKKINVNVFSGEDEATKQKNSDSYDPVSPFKSDYVTYGEDVGTAGSIGENQHEMSSPYGPQLQITDVDYDGGKHDHGENGFRESLSYREHGVDDAVRNVPDDAFNPLTQYRNGEKLKDKITNSETMRYNGESDVEDEDTGGYAFALNYESKNPEEKENHEEKIIFQPNNGHRPNEEIFDVTKYEENERHGSVPHENEENQFGNHGAKGHVFVNSEPYEPEEETAEVSELGDIDESDSVFYIRSKNNHNFREENDFEGTEMSGLNGGMIRIVEQDKYNPEASFENGNPEDEKSFGAKISLENSGIHGSNGELTVMIEKGRVGESESIKQNFENDENLGGIREITGFALSETDRKLLEDAVEEKVEEYNLENNFGKEKYIQDEFGPKLKFRESGVHLPDKELVEIMQPDSSGDYDSAFHYTDELKNNEDFARQNKFSGINIFGLGGGPSDNERKRVNDLISQLEAEHFRDAAIYGQKIRLDKIGLNEKLADQKEKDLNIGYESIDHLRNGYFKNGEYGQGSKFTESDSYVPNIEIIDLSNQEENDAEYRVKPFEYERFKGEDDFGRKIRFDDSDLYGRNEGVNDETKTRQNDNFDSSGSYRFGNVFGRANGFESNEPSGSKERMSGHGEGKYREIEGYDSLIGFENKFKFDKNFGRKIRFEDSPSADGKGSSDSTDLKYIGRLKDFLRIRENFGNENKFSKRGLFSTDGRNIDFGHQKNNDGNYDGARFQYGRFKDDDTFGLKVKFVDMSPNSEVRNEPNFEAMSRYSRHFPNDGFSYGEKLGNSGSFGEFRFPEANERILGESGHEGYDSIVRFEKEKLKLGQDFGQKIRYDETQHPEMKRDENDESFGEFDSIHRDPNRNDFQNGENEGREYTFWERESTKRNNEGVGVMNHKQVAGYGSPFHLRSDTFTDADNFGEKIVPLKV